MGKVKQNIHQLKLQSDILLSKNERKINKSSHKTHRYFYVVKEINGC